MIVLDTSAVLLALTAIAPPEALMTRLREAVEVHAPHLIDVEVLHALRSMTRRHELTEDRATDALADFGDLPILRYSHEPLRQRAWQLRANVTAYDAVFVALAENLRMPLITSDPRLARATGVRTQIELYDLIDG